jgi:hypothetical protein
MTDNTQQARAASIPDTAIEAAAEQWGDGMNFLIIDRVRARIKKRVERAGEGPWRTCITTPGRVRL